jgi:hypothetical protein
LHLALLVGEDIHSPSALVAPLVALDRHCWRRIVGGWDALEAVVAADSPRIWLLSPLVVCVTDVPKHAKISRRDRRPQHVRTQVALIHNKSVAHVTHGHGGPEKASRFVMMTLWGYFRLQLGVDGKPGVNTSLGFLGFWCEVDGQ